MSQPQHEPMGLEAFFAWQETQPARYELVGGVPIRMMAGSSNRHDRISFNLLLTLGNQLRGTPCRPITSDSSVETYSGQIRRPDVGVDCGPFRPDEFKASEPRFVAEVLSPSTRGFDTFEKVREYKAVAGLAYILLVEPNAPEAVMWVRREDGWRPERAEGLDAVLALPAIGVTLRLADLYDGIDFPPGPRLAFGRLLDEEG